MECLSIYNKHTLKLLKYSAHICIIDGYYNLMEGTGHNIIAKATNKATRNDGVGSN